MGKHQQHRPSELIFNVQPEDEMGEISPSFLQNQETIHSLSELYGNQNDRRQSSNNNLSNEGLRVHRKSFNSVRSFYTSRSQADDENERGFHSESHSIADLNHFSLYPTLRFQKRGKQKWKENESRGCCYSIQNFIYKFLNRPSNAVAIAYHILVLTILLIYTGIFILTDRGIWHDRCNPRIPIRNHKDNPRFLFETILIIYNCGEFLLRLWSSRSLAIYGPMSICAWLLSYLSRLSHIFDVILIVGSFVVVPCYFPITRDATHIVFILIVLRAFHRLFNVAQWTSVQLRESPWKLMGEVFREQGHILLGMVYLEIMLICFMGYSVFVVEAYVMAHDNSTQQEQSMAIHDLADALYWSSITLATIGYGEIVPLSYGSKLITFVCLMISMSLYSLPSGIIATSLALKINAKEEQQKRKEQRNLAASLIQNVWRLWRREKRFRLAAELWNRVLQANSAPDKKMKKKIKIAKRLRAKVKRIMTKRNEFFAYRFIQLTRIQVLKTQFETNSTHTIRTSIQCHWMEHRSLTTMLDSIRLKLDQECQLVKEQEEIEEELAHKLDEIQLKLVSLSRMAGEQQETLKNNLNSNN